MVCEEKQAFRSLRSAAEAALEQLREFGPRRPYWCEECHSFHLTSQMLTEDREAAEAQVLELAKLYGMAS